MLLSRTTRQSDTQADLCTSHSEDDGSNMEMMSEGDIKIYLPLHVGGQGGNGESQRSVSDIQEEENLGSSGGFVVERQSSERVSPVCGCMRHRQKRKDLRAAKSGDRCALPLLCASTMRLVSSGARHRDRPSGYAAMLADHAIHRRGLLQSGAR